MSQETHTEGLDIFQEHINIELFNDIVAFIMATTAMDPSPVRRKLNLAHLWYSDSKNNNIQDRYGFRYLGELLERYEDKVGSDIKDIRAIALAMAYSKELLTDDMFVGRQKISFLKKITGLSDGDIYLKSARYLMDSCELVDDDAVFTELTQASYTRTEDIIFIASLFDEFERAMDTIKAQLIELLGTARTMSVYGNVRVYAWLIRQLYKLYKMKCTRSKDMTLFRALIELPATFVRAESKYYAIIFQVYSRFH